MSARTVLYVLLAAVAVCAAVLSFAALRDLALVCGFVPWSAPLLPLVIDAGAAAGTLAWLTREGRARWFGRLLALVLLAASVAGNAVGHALAAYSLTAPWWLVVVVSGVAPAVLGAVTHLAVVAARAHTVPAELAVDGMDDDPWGVGMADEHGLSRLWETAPEFPTPGTRRDLRSPAIPEDLDQAPPGAAALGERRVQVGDDRAAELIAAGAGRRRLSRELDISEHQARELLAAARNGNGQVTR